MHSHTFAFHFSFSLHCTATISVAMSENVVADCSTSFGLFLYLLDSFGPFFIVVVVVKHYEVLVLTRMVKHSNWRCTQKLALSMAEMSMISLLTRNIFIFCATQFSICIISIAGFHPMQAFNSNVFIPFFFPLSFILNIMFTHAWKIKPIKSIHWKNQIGNKFNGISTIRFSSISSETKNEWAQQTEGNVTK